MSMSIAKLQVTAFANRQSFSFTLPTILRLNDYRPIKYWQHDKLHRKTVELLRTKSTSWICEFWRRQKTKQLRIFVKYVVEFSSFRFQLVFCFWGFDEEEKSNQTKKEKSLNVNRRSLQMKIGNLVRRRILALYTGWTDWCFDSSHISSKVPSTS